MYVDDLTPGHSKALMAGAMNRISGRLRGSPTSFALVYCRSIVSDHHIPLGLPIRRHTLQLQDLFSSFLVTNSKINPWPVFRTESHLHRLVPKFVD